MKHGTQESGERTKTALGTCSGDVVAAEYMFMVNLSIPSVPGISCWKDSSHGEAQMLARLLSQDNMLK